MRYLLIIVLFPFFTPLSIQTVFGQKQPFNVVIIYTDDVGYGDLSCYGATSVKTPHADRLAKEGLRFTNAHSTAATCTPSRYALLTGEYPWRKKGTAVATGDAPMIVTPERFTLADLFKNAGYTTGAVGKWHLGLGAQGSQDWNGTMSPALNDIGFDYSYIMAATGDRVPCVFLENQRVNYLDPKDPIEVSYKTPFVGEPTGKNNPELLKLHPSVGHNQAVVNGIPRIGYMRGGKSALWFDENIADSITSKAVKFIENNKKQPFFLYFATNDIHVPRVPHPRFVGQTTMGARGDAIVEMDWSVGQILETLDKNGLTDNTLIIFTSDNGPVVDDGYKDEAVAKLGNHKPAGILRGGKYSTFEAGTRVPFIIRFPNKIKKGVSDALVSQIDMMATCAKLLNQNLPEDAAPDSFAEWQTWSGKNKKGREYLISSTNSAILSIRQKGWKYIEPSKGAAYDKWTNTELGNSPTPQLYNLKKDIGEKQNIADKQAKQLVILQEKLALVRNFKSSRLSK
jgi:arylsulfatase A-like enzyme